MRGSGVSSSEGSPWMALHLGLTHFSSLTPESLPIRLGPAQASAPQRCPELSFSSSYFCKRNSQQKEFSSGFLRCPSVLSHGGAHLLLCSHILQDAESTTSLFSRKTRSDTELHATGACVCRWRVSRLAPLFLGLSAPPRLLGLIHEEQYHLKKS